MELHQITHYVTVPRMARTVRFPNNVTILRENSGLLQKDIAKALNITPADVSRKEAGKNAWTQEQLIMLDQKFGWTPNDVLGVSAPPIIRIKNYVGAGAKVYPIEDDNVGIDTEVECPKGLMPEEAAALLVQGDSQKPRLEPGDIIFFKRNDAGVPNECIGRLCVVELMDGCLLVKKVRKGTKPHHYHLISHNDDPMLDQKLRWASRVIDIKPA